MVAKFLKSRVEINFTTGFSTSTVVLRRRMAVANGWLPKDRNNTDQLIAGDRWPSW